MKLSANEEYGLRCLVRIGYAGKAGSLTIPEMSRAEGVSPAYAAKILRVLRKGGFVKAERGKEGGYTLGKDSDRVVFVVGLSFQAPRQWTVDDAGRLRLETAASPARRTDAVADAVAVDDGPGRVFCEDASCERCDHDGLSMA